MELFKSKESFQTKPDSNCIAKNDFRETSIFKIIIRICEKNEEFYGKTSKFYPKDFYSFFAFLI